MSDSNLPLRPNEVKRLIGLARDGSTLASGKLLEACRGYLLLIANGQVDADWRQKVGGSDLVQDTFVQAYRDFPSFKGNSERALLAWLRKILLSKVAQTRRHFQQTLQRDVSRERPLRQDGSTNHPSVVAVCPRESPSRALIAAEELRNIEIAMGRLPVEYAVVIQLRSRDLLDHVDVGQRLGISAEAARKLWARAIVRIQREMGEASS